mgnify:CR=1 FL=1
MRMGIISFSVGSRTYKFKEPLMLDNDTADGQLCLSHRGLKLCAYGSSWGECNDQIREQLAMLWEDYALAQDEELTNGAIALKEKLLGMVE